MRGRLVCVHPGAAEIRPLSPDQILGEFFDPMVRIWMAAMRRPPDHPRSQTFGQALQRHVTSRDFRCRVAHGPQGQPVGFAYGYTGCAGQWWTDLIAAAMDEATRDRWMNGHFELVEIHVHPQWQGRGIGGSLHDSILEGLPNATALLSTQKGPTAAFALYQKRGWETLIEGFLFPQETREYRIMGLRLKPER
jgi:ribosomal protein S18 acetylase RimI-like enzyme